MLKTPKKSGSFFLKYKKSYFTGILILMLTNVIVVLFPWVLGKALDSIVQGSLGRRELLFYLALLCLLFVSEYLFGFLWQYKIFKNSILIQKELISSMFQKFMHMKTPFFEKYNTGDLMARATGDVAEIRELGGFGVLAASDGIGFSLAVLLAMCFFVSWKLTLVSILPLPFMAILVQILGKYVHERYMRYQSAFAEMNDKTLEYLAGIRLVRAYTMDERILQTFQDCIQKARQNLLSAQRISSAFMPLSHLFTALCTAFAIFYGSILIREGELSLGALISFQIYLHHLAWPMFAIGEFINIAGRGSASIRRVDAVLQEKNRDEEELLLPLSDSIQSILFRDYCFSYPGSSGLQLSHIDLEIRKSRTLGIVGKTGSGKSTFLKQILKRYDMGQGSLSVNGLPINRIEDGSLMDKIGYVAQDNILFSRSIRENILFGGSSADAFRLQEVLHLADFEKDVFALPQGLDTLVGERGIAVSGGQKQRISIARALLKDPEILILDDALSAVDAKTEQKIIENIRKNRAGKTTLIVAHRLSALEHADEIIVLDRGEITERGTHHSLLQIEGWYKEQYTIQKLEDGNEP